MAGRARRWLRHAVGQPSCVEADRAQTNMSSLVRKALPLLFIESSCTQPTCAARARFSVPLVRRKEFSMRAAIDAAARSCE